MAKPRFKIDGVVIPTPDKMTWSIEDLSSDETGRSLDGVMHKDVVAVKDYYNCEWKVLSGEEAALLLSLVDGRREFSFYHRDPRGNWATGTYYVGKRDGEAYDLTDPVMTFKNVKMQFTKV